MATEKTTRDKVIIITGSSRGIGYHLANRFIESGFKVIGVSRSGTSIKHNNFQDVIMDVSNLSEIENLGNEIDLSSVHGIINNAGMHGPLGPFEKNDMTKWVETFYVNLFGGAALTQMCIPSLKKNNGFVIFLSGGGSGFAKPNFSAYSVSKTAVVRLAENLAKELNPDVFVYCVAPGSNRTEMLEVAIKAGDDVKEKDVVDFKEPEDLCLFLADNKDLRYSGKFIHVKDNYKNWGEKEFSDEMYKLRRLKVL
ncbi:MAG: SDR family oxidoreductase [Candidatus Aenigmarchaeota archaeon]|nr:SDR family oxidoreductase [Candidatus Aenigmarchaeota archaeon]